MFSVCWNSVQYVRMFWNSVQCESMCWNSVQYVRVFWNSVQ